MECTNCGRSIGKLESPQVYQDQVVCPECKSRLEPVRVREVASASQRRAAAIACTGIVAFVFGMWMFSAYNQTHKYDYLGVPGMLLIVIGGLGTFGGIFLFAADRLRK